MNYPVWQLDVFGGGLWVILIAVFHVYIAHFAVGGGLFLVLAERKAHRENNPAMLDHVRRHARFFLLVTMVLGSMTGVGIWFIIALLNPAATSLLIHDSTGQPWPITSVTNGGPAFFQVLRPELPDGNLLNIMPTQGYGTTTIVVTLEKQDIPLVIRLESDSVRGPERKADALVLFQIAQHGPRAKVPLIQDIKETVSSSMLAFLDHVPPAEAVRVKVEPRTDKVHVWKLGDLHYIRTNHTLVWPAWTAVVNGAGGMKCYEVPVTSRIMISQAGSMQTLVLSDVLKTGNAKASGEVKP